jgi:exoribonuclease-2
LERYWSLRWLEQEKLQRIDATVLKGDVVRIDGLPFITRIPGLPELPRGQRIELDVVATNHVDLTLETRVHRVLAAQTIVDVDDEELGDDSVEVSPLSVAEQMAEAVRNGDAEAGADGTSIPSNGTTSAMP